MQKLERESKVENFHRALERKRQKRKEHTVHIQSCEGAGRTESIE